MSKNIKILIDTSSGLLRREAESLGYEMIALPFLLDEKEYDDDKITLSEFYNKLREAKDIHTSQAPIATVVEKVDNLLKTCDHVIYFPITSGLSSAYNNSVVAFSEDKYKGKVTCIDHKTISVLERAMLIDVKKLLEKGFEPSDIKKLIEDNAKYNRIYITVDTLEYLKKGGRVSALSATIGNLLAIKPVLFSNGGKFEVIKKVRGLKLAENTIKELVMADFSDIFKDIDRKKIALGVAYTECKDEAISFKKASEDEFKTDMSFDELPSVIGCHIGAGAVAIGVYKHLDEC